MDFTKSGKFGMGTDDFSKNKKFRNEFTLELMCIIMR